ncbi:MAG: hypothetical protein KME52_02520 [Desmonostoc geniculatum HA4340-LM1]|nr:hypothetical protein [Desmonostoc geniculatum HA4340-LM1]
MQCYTAVLIILPERSHRGVLAIALFNEPLQAKSTQKNQRAMPSLQDATPTAGFAYALWS